MLPYYHTYCPNRFAEEDAFGARVSQPWPWAYFNSLHPESAPEGLAEGFRPDHLPDFAEAASLLPEPHWEGHEAEIRAYWRVWELIFPSKLRRATAKNRFVSHFCSTAFNDATFLWDSAFIARYGLYGRRAWNFQATLDNFYAKQHPDGFICREIREADGEDKFQRHDPSSTGPNVLPWAEWDHFQLTGDSARLARVAAPLAAYTRWMRLNRTWPDGSYWATGWSSGMDNQPRLPEGFHEWYEHGHQAWVDACFQGVLASRLTARILREVGRAEDAAEFDAEAQSLAAWCNEHLWCETTSFYHDRRRDGSLHTSLKTIGACWALLAEAVPPHRIERFLSHLQNPTSFARDHPCPAISADSPGFDPDGGYWRGGVWPPTNFMLFRGLRTAGRAGLAHTLARRHLHHVAICCAATGTLWETYAPDRHAAGRGQPDFTGWSGLGPVAMLFEDIFGLQPDAPARRLTWRIFLTEGFGVRRYPFGLDDCLSLWCEPRTRAEEEPRLSVETSCPLELEIWWAGGRKVMQLQP